MIAIETRLDDMLADPLAPARAAEAAIGYIGADIPEDLLAATGRFHVHLPWRIGGATPFADAWLESSFPPWTRSCLEDWARGHFDFLEAVIFTRGEDSLQRLYYYICELQRTGRIGGPEPLIFDTAKIDRPSSVARTVESVRALARRFEISDERLAEGIAGTNRRRRTFSALQRDRVSEGPLYEKIARANLFARVEIEAVGDHRAAAGRVLLSGTPPPDDHFHRAVEATGWTIAAETHVRGLCRLGPVIETSDDPATAIGRHVHAQAVGARGFADRAARLVDHAREARADAVILWLIEEEEALGWDLPAQRRALAAAGIPLLALTRRRWSEDDGAAAAMQDFVRDQVI